MSAGRQNGYILLPVVLLITLISVVAFLLNHQSALGTGTAGSLTEAQQAEQVASAGLAHAQWWTQTNGCLGDQTMTTVPFGASGTHNYIATVASPGGTNTSNALSADQDAWFRSDNITTNNGTTATYHLRMESGNLEYALVRFDLSTLPAGAQIQSATARFYVKATKGHPEGAVKVHRVTADWTETGATWETMSSSFDSAVLNTIPPQPDVGDNWVQVNLTAQVQAWVNGETNYGIMLVPTGEGTHAEYISREGAASQQPRLDVVVGTGPATPVTITASGTLNSGVTRTLTANAVPAHQPASTLFLQPDPTAGKDAWLSEDKPSWNYGIFASLRARGGGGGHWHSPIQFELHSLPRGARVLTATLELYRFSTSQDFPGPINLHAITQSWEEGNSSGGTNPGATWDLRDTGLPWNTPGGDFDATPAATAEMDAGTDTWFSWDLTSLVQDWADGTRKNYGMMLVAGDAVARAEFSSSDDVNPALRPKLTVRYACECGVACLAPQGSGRIALIGDDSSPDPDDQLKIKIIESWGYDVDFYEDQDSDTINWSNYDLAYVSETVISGDVNANLTTLSIGVVNEEPKLYDDLQLASGDTEHVGSSIDIIDNSHYISSIFPLGALSIYDAGMEILTADTPLAGGLQTLGEYSGAATLTALDQGAPTTSGTAAGRRVTLPLGQHFASNFNWAQLNNNGRLMVQRAIAWGMKADIGSAGNVLLVVGDPGTLTAQETAKQALIETWDFTVNLIDESDSQANFDVAIAANDVAYIPQDINSTSLGTKLRNATIGVVNEEGEQVDELGFSDDKLFKSNHEIDVVDNSHYITETFSTGLLTFTSSDQSIHMLNGWYSPGLQTLGQTLNTGSNYNPSLVTLDAGDAIYSGGTAAGRRVQLPWGGGTFDINSLTDDGHTIMRRALEWAAGSGGVDLIGHWKFDDGAGTQAADSSGRGNDGTLTDGPVWTTGKLAGALDFDGGNDRILVPDDPSLDITDAVTLAAWVRPNKTGTQYLIRKAQFDSTDGYELSLSTTGKVFFRLNQASNANTYRIDSTTDYPNNGSTWMHIAGTYDGAVMRLYLDGVEVATLDAAISIATNDTDLSIGAQVDGSRGIDGVIDDVRLYGEALDATAVAGLASGGSSPKAILLVVGDATTLAGKDAGYKALMETWGHTVTLIDDGDSQTNFNTAMAAADVVYVSGTSSGPTLLDKVTGTTTGVVNEINGKIDNFGFSSSTGSTVNADTFTKTDALHYITEPFGGNPVTVFNTSLINPVPGGTLAPELSNVGEATGTPALVTLDAGATRHDGNPAPARRVHLPFTSAQTADLTADGETILQRTLEWAAGAGVGAGGGGGPGINPPGGCDGTYRDEFGLRQYDQHDGSLGWTGNWEETGETTDPTGGDIRVDNDVSNYQLQVRDDGQTVWREADLSGAGSATLSFDYRRENLSGSGDYVAVEVSYDGGTTWAELERFTGTATDAAYISTSHVLDAGSLSANTRIRFLTPNTGMGNSNMVWFDNIQIQCSP